MHVITLDFCISVAHFATVIAAYCWVYDWISVISASSDSGQYVIVRVVLHLLFMNCSCVNWQEHEEDDGEWEDVNDDDDADDDDMNGGDSLPGLLSQLGGDGRCPHVNFELRNI